jgi:hypothetical protein
MNTAALLRSWALLALLCLAGCSTVPPADRPAADLRLPVPQAEAERAYLGLASGQERFLLEDIRCEVIFVDCFDMYCHSCHTGAKRVNELYRLVQDRGLGDRIKFVGLGLNNTPLEASTFKKKFDVPFPVFPDRFRDVADQFGRARLPSLLVVCNRTASLRLIHQHNGTLDDPVVFLEHIVEEMKQDCPDPKSDMLQPSADCESGVCDVPDDTAG